MTKKDKESEQQNKNHFVAQTKSLVPEKLQSTHHQVENAPKTTTKQRPVKAPLPCRVLHNISKKFKKISSVFSVSSVSSFSFSNLSISLISNLILLLSSSLLFTFFLTQFELSLPQEESLCFVNRVTCHGHTQRM